MSIGWYFVIMWGVIFLLFVLGLCRCGRSDQD